MKILVADPLSEKGHLNFNSNFIKWFDGNYSIAIDYYFSDSMLHAMELNGETFPDLYLKKDNPFKYKINQIKILNDIYNYAVRNKYDKLLILSYELYSTSVFFNMKNILANNNIEIYLIEHNTIPTSFIKDFFYKLIPKKNITHIGLMPYISEYIYNKYNKKSIYIPHPIRKITEKCSKKSDGVISVFMPSYVEESLKAQICKSFQELGDKFLLKTKGDLGRTGNIIKQEYFDNYDSELLKADAIFIPQKFEYRVSGVLYEALQTDAKIFMSNCLFAQSLRKQFHNKIVLVNDWVGFIKNNLIDEINNKDRGIKTDRELFNASGKELVHKDLLCLK